MSEYRCPNCHQPNPANTARCQSCGINLNSRAVVITQRNPLVVSKRPLPAPPLKTIGASVALGALAILADVGVRYLRGRLRLADISLPTRTRHPQKVVQEVRVEETRPQGQRVVTVYSERVIEERRWGRPVRRIVDRLAWRSEESLNL